MKTYDRKLQFRRDDNETLKQKYHNQNYSLYSNEISYILKERASKISKRKTEQLKELRRKKIEQIENKK